MSNAERRLALETQAVMILRDMLVTITDDEGIADSIASETNLQEAIDAVLSGITEDEALCAGLRIKCEEMVNRRLRLEHRIERRRAAIERAMSAAEMPKLELAAATLSLRRVPPGLEIISEDQLPRFYFKTPLPKLDKAALKDDLKNGIEVPGARLDNGNMSLTIRRA